MVSFDGWPLTGTSPAGGRNRTLSIDGWLAKTLRRSRQPRAGQDGNWASTGRVEGKTITIKGTTVYASATDAAIERRQMLALGGRGLTELMIEDAALTLTAQVELDAVDARVVRDTMVEFTITVHAPDPVLYGPPVTASTGLADIAGTGRVWPRVWPRDWGVPAGVTPGSIAVPNAGTTAYWPTGRIDGPIINPVVTLNETGDWIRINRTVDAGQWLDIDFGSRRVMLNGTVPLTYAVTFSGQWLAVPVGGASISIAADDADPAALLTISAFEGAYE